MSKELVKFFHGLYSHIPREPSSVLFATCNFNASIGHMPSHLIMDHAERPIRSSSPKLVKAVPQLGPNTSGPRKLASLTAAAAAGGGTGGQPLPTLDLTEDNIRQVLADARTEFGQIFDTSVGMTGQAELAELDGPFVKISLKGRFWHKRSTVLARVGNYLKQRIPEILEVDIEDEKQLDDSPENF